MKIIELQAENIKRLKVVRIVPKGNTVVLGGDNEQGKSSVMDCIEMALGGAGRVPSVPIRSGATAGKIRLDLGELKVERAFSTSKGTSLVVTSADGKRIASPQAVLDKLYSSIAFDPLEFANQKPAEQVATLRRIVGLDFSALDAIRARVYQEREASGRVLAQAKARLSTMPAPATDVPAEEVSVATLMAQKEDADEINRQHARTRELLDCATKEWAARERVVQDLREKLHEAQDALERAEEHQTSLRTKCAQLHEDIDTAPIIEKIKGAESINRTVREKLERAKEQDNVNRMEGERLSLTSAIEDIDTKKAKALSEAKWPIEGLGFSDEGVTYNGLPFSQAGASARLRTSVAIGCAQHPDLQVMLVRDASLLDQKSMEMLATLAEEKDEQLWIERVSQNEPGAVIIEDGEVIRVNPAEGAVILEDGEIKQETTT
jgi:DNA repair exonuclease SbcCD ATPase subunit